MSVIVRKAKAEDELALKRLFLNCFDDTLGSVNMFFAHHFVPDCTLVAERDKRITGLAFLLPCKTADAPCFYAYGVCVAPDERSHGIGTALLSRCVELSRDNGCSLILHPENESLFAFYEKAGFSPCSYYKSKTVAPTAAPAELSDITAAEYLLLRDKGFADRNPVMWDLPSVEYALAHETFFGGRAFKYSFEGKEGVVLCGKVDGTPFIKETTATGDALEAVCAAVARLWGGEEVSVLLPGSEDDTPCAYGIGFTSPVYLNLMLD